MNNNFVIAFIIGCFLVFKLCDIAIDYKTKIERDELKLKMMETELELQKISLEKRKLDKKLHVNVVAVHDVGEYVKNLKKDQE